MRLIIANVEGDEATKHRIGEDYPTVDDFIRHAAAMADVATTLAEVLAEVAGFESVRALLEWPLEPERKNR